MKKFFTAVSALALLGINTASAQEYGLGIDYGASSTSNYSLGVDTTLPAPNFGQAGPSIEPPTGPMPALPSPLLQYVTPMPGNPPTLQGLYQTPDATVSGSITLPPASPGIRFGLDVPLQGGGSIGTAIMPTPSVPAIDLHINKVPLGPSGDTTIGGKIFHSPLDTGGSILFTTPLPNIFNGN